MKLMKSIVTKQVLSEFTAVQEKCLHHLQESSSLATSLGGISSAVVHFETFRTRTPEALSTDSSFIQVQTNHQMISFNQNRVNHFSFKFHWN